MVEPSTFSTTQPLNLLMTPALQTYFQAEKKESMLFIAIGILACWVGAALCMEAAVPFYIGLALPLLAVGIIQIIVGTTVTRRTDQQLDDLEQLLVNDPAEFRQTETSRMATVMRNFVAYRWAEVAFVLVGAILLFWQREFVFSRGLGFGLLGQGAVMLIADYFAEKRGHIYQAFVASIGKSPSNQ